MRGKTAAGALVAVFGMSVTGTSLSAQTAPGDVLVLTNGRIWTGDSARPWAEALAIRRGRVLSVGTSVDVMSDVGANERLHDLHGRFVVPGFVDGHTHFRRAGQLLLGVNLLDASDDTTLRRKIAEADQRLPARSWMVGGDWGAYDLDSRWVPRRSLLDSITGERPALLNKWDRSQFVGVWWRSDAVGSCPLERLST